MKHLLLVLFFSFFLCSCIKYEDPRIRCVAPAPMPPNQEDAAWQPSLNTAAVEMVQRLKAAMPYEELVFYPCIVTTLVEVDDLERTGRFGRIFAEFLGAELTAHGGKVFDIRPAGSLFVQKQHGETILSRDPHEIMREVPIRAILAGTYSVAERNIYINIRLIELPSRRIISTASLEYPKTTEVKALFGEKIDIRPSSYEK